EHGLVEPMQRRQELTDVIRAAGIEADEIDASREDTSLPREYHGLGILTAQFLEVFHQSVAEFDIEHIGFAVTHRHDRDVVLHRNFDHAPAPASTGFRARMPSPCQSRSACTMAMVKTRIATI